MTSTNPKRPSGDIRRRLLAGEPLTSEGTASDYGCSRSLLGQVVTAIEGEGVTVAREPSGVPLRGQPKTFRVIAPPPDPELASTWGKGRGVKKPTASGNRRAAAVAKAAPTNGVVRAAVNGKALGTEHPVPVLGESLQVFLLALTEDGRVNVGLRDGEQTWLTTIDGFSR